MLLKNLFRVPLRPYTNEAVDLAHTTFTRLNSFQNVPLIVVDGLFGSKNNFAYFCRKYELLTKRKIISVDLRNHGDSPRTSKMNYQLCVEDFKTLQEKLSITKSAFLGYSTGGRAAMLFALYYPQLVEKLIVVDISPFSTADELKEMSTILKAIEKITLPKKVSFNVAKMQVNEELKKIINGPIFREYMLLNLVADGANAVKWQCNFEAIQENFQEFLQFPTINNLQFDGPTLFVAGELSNYIPKNEEKRLKENFPNAQLEYLKGTSHWLHYEKPTKFLVITAKFLNKKTYN